MAQTTQNASFGPIFLIAAQLNPPHRLRTWIEPKKNKKNKLNMKEKKDHIPMAQNDAKHVVWARFSHRRPTESTPSL